MKAVLDPDRIPMSVRKVGNFLLPTSVRHRLARHLNDLHENRWRTHPHYAENQRRWHDMKNAHASETAVIIGNGPSMKDFDLSRLEGAVTFCLNRGTLLWREQNRTPDYLVVLNELVIEEFGDEIAAFNTRKIIPWRCAETIPPDANTTCVHSRWKRAFHRDLEHGLWVGGTVTFAAMQVAWHMGFRKVILIGVDHRFTFSGKPNETQIAEGPDTNHFHPEYFSDGHRWQTPDLLTCEQAYQMAREAFEQDGRQILDATEGGALNVFPKVAPEDTLHQIEKPSP